MYCLAYVEGYLDGTSSTVAVSNLSSEQRKICLPEKGLFTDDAVRIFLKHLRENPKQLNQSGRINLTNALRNAFPCKKA